MLDYRAHIAGLRVMEQGLAALVSSGSPPDPSLVAVRNAVEGQPSYAHLGAVLDHLFEHTGASDAELGLLETASAIWRDIGNFMNSVADVRSKLESLVLNPSQPGAVDTFNALADRLHTELQPQYNTLVADLQAYYAAVRTLHHVTQHGQALDQPENLWTWRDIILSRRTAALMVNLADAAGDVGSQEATAFAFGALSSYASNVIGSAYQNHVVGGPRRSHPYRDRLASYSIGAWLGQNFSGLAMPLNQIRASLSFGAPNAPALPAVVSSLLATALNQTYGNAGSGPLPDLNEAYQKLMRQLDLLTAFTPLPLPEPINDTLYGKIVTLDEPTGPGGGSSSGSGATPQQAPSSDQGIPWWQWVLFAVCVVAVALCFLLGICGASKKDPYRGPFQDPDPAVNTSALTSYLSSDEVLVSVNVMFNLHVQLYDMAQNALKVLKLIGMVYPEANDLTEKEFAQFTAIPRAEQEFPKRQIPNMDLFLGFPTSPTEHPQTKASPFGPGDSPIDFLAGGGASGDTVQSYGLALWVAQALGDPASGLREVNRNLDADRSYKHPCWKIEDGSSITNDPVLVKILGYGEV